MIMRFNDEIDIDLVRFERMLGELTFNFNMCALFNVNLKKPFFSI